MRRLVFDSVLWIRAKIGFGPFSTKSGKYGGCSKYGSSA